MEPVKVEDLNIALVVVAEAVLKLHQQLAEFDLYHLTVKRKIEIDGLTPHPNYCRDCDVCEGMDW
jgi:hypothetical protein